MGRHVCKLQQEASNNQQTIDNREQFIEVVFRPHRQQHQDELNCKQVDEDGIDDLVDWFLCEEVEGRDDEGYHNEDCTYQFVFS